MKFSLSLEAIEIKSLYIFILPNRLLSRISQMQQQMRTKSIHAAIREQRLLPLYHRLTEIVPDITHQYTSFDLDSEYLTTKVRAQHSFQIALANEAIRSINNSPEDMITIVDIGDSAGTHLQYLKGVHQDHNIRCLSVNLDSNAVKRIKNKGLDAICARAEDLTSLSVKADIFLSFEMLEHLVNPCEFLQSLSETNCKAFVVTVPYVACSRVGLHHIRQNRKGRVNPENTHIFELSPEDWRLIFKHSGWAIQSDKIYLQYPRKLPLRFIWRRYWKRFDYEGFYGAILKPDKSWSNLYEGW